MTFALFFITDGRDEYHKHALASAKEMLPEPEYFIEVSDPEHELGFDGAIRKGWRRVLAETDAEFIFHLEADFTFNRKVPVAEMAAVLKARPYLLQLALRRQPWNDQEKAAGGIVEMDSASYAEEDLNGWRWLEHTKFFTTNPSLYPRAVCEYGWPQGTESEGRFGIEIREDRPELRFGFWGAFDSGEAITHIGAERVGTRY